MDRDEDFRAFVEGSWARLVRTALLLGCRPADAEDLAQGALLRAYLADDATARVDLSELLMQALRRLTPNHRAVVVLRYYADLSDAQVAAVLGVPVGTVKSRLHRAQRHLLEDQSLLGALERGAS